MYTKSGIYTITHAWTGIVYVGRSEDIFGRWRQHYDKLVKNMHHCNELQTAWNKYREREFVFAVYRECDPEQLVQEEKWCIDTFKIKDEVRLFNSECNPYTPTYRPGGARFTDEQARDVKRRHQAGESGKKLAKEYNVAPQTIYALSNGQTYKDISV